MTYSEITTPCGVLKGNKKDGYSEFLGVRYARAERFSMPQTVSSWSGVYDATTFGDCCPQYRQFHDESLKKNTLWYDEFRKGLTFSYSEDCLNLNVYAPDSGENLPVLLFIHGGSFVKGSSSEKAFDGAEYAKRGVILITINYRLNVFGFFADDNVSNLALHDMLAALKWVKRNVSSFGGNPDAITLFGQSAGAMSVQALISNPEVKKQINGAVMLSGGGLLKGIYAPHSIKHALKFSRLVQKSVEAIGKIKTIPYEKLFEAYEALCTKHPLLSMLACSPSFDGTLLDKSVFKDVANYTVPSIIGVTKDDLPPKNYLRNSALDYAKKSSAPVWLFYFDRNLPGDDNGAWHSSDLWYVFGTLRKSPRPFVQTDFDISNRLLSAISEFARTSHIQNQTPAEYQKT